MAERPGLALPAGVRVGETWELVDRERENSVVAEGRFQGRTLRWLMTEHGAAILGQSPGRADGRFPLLVKFLDASDDLSIQVHPDDERAQELGGGAEGKTEAWYVVDVAPGGALYAGLEPGVDAAAFRALAGGAGVERALVRHDVRAGDCVMIEGGTVHAIGAGVTILEVQQNSDTTYRLWDWGRVGLDGKPRATHVEEALACMRFGVDPPSAVAGDREGELVRGRHFSMARHRVRGRREFPNEERFRIHVVLEGRGELVADERFPLAPGDTWLVPAATGAHALVGDDLSVVELG